MLRNPHLIIVAVQEIEHLQYEQKDRSRKIRNLFLRTERMRGIEEKRKRERKKERKRNTGKVRRKRCTAESQQDRSRKRTTMHHPFA